MPTEPPIADPPKRKRRWYQFRLRTLLIVVALLAVASGYFASQAQIVRERDSWLKKAHQRDVGPGVISLHWPKVLSLGSIERGPSFIRRWLGDVPQDEIQLWSITDDEKRRAVELFPEARVLDWD
jgi:hypothetical protein